MYVLLKIKKCVLICVNFVQYINIYPFISFPRSFIILLGLVYLLTFYLFVFNKSN